MDCSPPGASVHGILQARTQKNCTRKIFMTQIATMGMITLECDHILKCEVRRDLGSVACMLNHLSGVRLFPTLWTVAHQAPLSMEFSSQEYWRGLPFPSSGYLPDLGIKPESPALQADSLLSEPQGSPHMCICFLINIYLLSTS